MRSLSPRRLAVALSVVALVAGPVSPSPAQAAPAAADPTWRLETVDGPHGAGRANFDYPLDAGGRIDDVVRVVNTGDDDATIALYPADGFTTTAGDFDLRTADAERTGVGAWVALAADEVVLAPGEAADVPFRIDVPADARGEYVGGIVSAGVTDPGNVEQRVALRVRLHVGASFRPALTVEDVRVDYSGPLLGTGTATIGYTVRNSGDTAISSEQSVSVAGPFGIAARSTADFPSTPQLLPGESWTMTTSIDGVPPLVGLTATVSAVPLYTDAAGSTGPLPAVQAAGFGWAPPWSLIGVSLLVIAVLIVGATWLRRVARLRVRPRDVATHDAVSAEAAFTGRGSRRSSPG